MMYFSNTWKLYVLLKSKLTLWMDIPIFNGNDSTQLEHWLVDIETAADLTAKSRTNLAQATSKELTHTLITEAVTLGKCWDGMKDLIHLKLCNLDIDTAVSCLMEIQQKEKDTLAAYIHCFKWEAKRYNYTNSAAKISISMDVSHSVWYHIYFFISLKQNKNFSCETSFCQNPSWLLPGLRKMLFYII